MPTERGFPEVNFFSNSIFWSSVSFTFNNTSSNTYWEGQRQRGEMKLERRVLVKPSDLIRRMKEFNTMQINSIKRNIAIRKVQNGDRYSQQTPTGR